MFIRLFAYVQCSRDIQIARTQERKGREMEVESTKDYFLEREAQTSDDLTALVALHDDRYAEMLLCYCIC